MKSLLVLFSAVLAAVPAEAQRDAEIGLASWYGYPFHGRRAAGGEIYDMETLTAAHRTLPFNTIVRVLNTASGQSVNVRITDRGPFIDGRIIDLSHAAARAIGLDRPGTAPVRLQVVQTPEEGSPAGYFSVQVGAFHVRSNAERFRAAMQARFGQAQLQYCDGDPGLWRVLVGAEATENAAQALSARIREETGEKKAFVARLVARESDGSELPSRAGGTVSADGYRPPAHQ